ncbi:hypothetical protein D3C87_1913320 [compost metagenome]
MGPAGAGLHAGEVAQRALALLGVLEALDGKARLLDAVREGIAHAGRVHHGHGGVPELKQPHHVVVLKLPVFAPPGHEVDQAGLGAIVHALDARAVNL